MARTGLFPDVVNPDGSIAMGSWLKAVSGKQFVGTCAKCWAPLLPQRPDEQTKPAITWFTARCSACGYEVASPSGRTLKRTFRHWERR